MLPVGAAFADYALGPIGNTVLKNPISGTTQFGYGSTTGDVDGDGIDDLIVAPNSGLALRILRGVAWTNIGRPARSSFRRRRSDTGTGFRANTLITGDFDGDGHDEIAFGNPSYSASVPGGHAYVARRDNAGIWDVVATIQQGQQRLSRRARSRRQLRQRARRRRVRRRRLRRHRDRRAQRGGRKRIGSRPAP